MRNNMEENAPGPASLLASERLCTMSFHAEKAAFDADVHPGGEKNATLLPTKLGKGEGMTGGAMGCVAEPRVHTRLHGVT